MLRPFIYTASKSPSVIREAIFSGDTYGEKLSPMAVAFTDEQTNSFMKLSVSSIKTQMGSLKIISHHPYFKWIYKQIFRY
ncbi:hypothetical protein IGI04_006641 [Brassica rapa subsp. trilocularis]|uniref:Uncharacterized protein n=1 Tax=Brassica rapa subsp. trilocularis TaxID=1813537 RepID=A0ABQ7NHF8_BRACM|nr:hypothetical protein IGI04_006641 [Brassica rapa subsp. trilocularis]